MKRRIGIIGGGQLASMMCDVSPRLGLTTTVIDPDPLASAARTATRHLVRGYRDRESLEALAAVSDAITFDLENVPVDLLTLLQERGMVIAPSPKTLGWIQDKVLQKDRLIALGLRTSRYVTEGTFPAVQKLRRGGYDGRGVKILCGPDDVAKSLSGPSFWEEKIDIAHEIGVMVARDREGRCVVYPPVEMVFREGHVLDFLIAPARLTEKQAHEALDLACRAVSGFEVVGICGVELFLDKSGRFLVNELSPRPHNSGHYTMDACNVSQFEQHLRAVAGLELVAPVLASKAVMFNLTGTLGTPGAEFPDFLEPYRNDPRIRIHWYAKPATKAGRKRGHVTFLDDDVQTALEKVGQFRRKFHV